MYSSFSISSCRRGTFQNSDEACAYFTATALSSNCHINNTGLAYSALAWVSVSKDYISKLKIKLSNNLILERLWQSVR